MEHQVHHLRDHHIVAGFGRVGRQTAQALRRLGHQVVVVDESPDAVRDAITADFLVVVGNATDDETLLSAGVERAAGLITALGSDADNVYVTLSSRALNPVLPIVARANSEGVLSKLTRAGATQVVSPYATTGRQLAQSVVRTRTTGEIVGSGSETSATLIVEALPLAPTSPLVGMTMQMLHERLPQPILLAVLRDGQTLAPPPPDLTLASGDELVAVGTESNLRLLTECDGLTR
jgi:voltage-gated potassium channel